jgi:hypothetical protein
MTTELPTYAWALPLLGLPILYALFVAARTVIRWGFFVFFAVIGTALAYLGFYTMAGDASQNLSYSIVAGLSFASVVSAIRARIARLVGILFVVAVVALVGWQL